MAREKKYTPCARMARLLEPHGFWPIWEKTRHFSGFRVDPRFGRVSNVKGCFEHVDIDFTEQPTCAWTIVGVLPGRTGWRQMSAGQLIFECDYASRQRTKISIETLGEVLPTRSDTFARQYGPVILARTEHARKAAKFYLTCVPEDIPDLPQYRAKLREMMSAEQLELAKFSIRTSVITCPYTSFEEEERVFAAYHIASYLFTIHASEATAEGFFAAGEDPHVNMDLAFCFQILASILLREKGYQEILLG